MLSQRRSKKANKGQKGKKKGGKDAGIRDTREYPAVAVATMAMVHYANPRRIDPFPQRYRTVLTTAFRGELGTGDSAFHLITRLNSPYLPFDTFSWPGANPGTTGLNATGFQRLCNVYAYRLFRVLSSRIVIEISTVADVDTLLVTVTPTSSGSNPPTAQAALSQEFTTYKQITRGQPMSSCRVVNKMSQNLLLGVRQQAIKDDLSGSFTGSYEGYPADQLYWVVNIVNLNSESFNTGVGYTVRLEHDVEFWGDTQGTDPALLETKQFRSVDDPKSVDKPSSFYLDAYIKAKEREKLDL